MPQAGFFGSQQPRDEKYSREKTCSGGTDIFRSLEFSFSQGFFFLKKKKA